MFEGFTIGDVIHDHSTLNPSADQPSRKEEDQTRSRDPTDSRHDQLIEIALDQPYPKYLLKTERSRRQKEDAGAERDGVVLDL
jgi:hypothetical protein